MLSSSSLKRAKSANAAFFSQEKRSTQTHPIALIIGGTSGIGRGIAITLARHTNGSCRILIVGRNRAAGEAVVASLPPFTGDGDGHEFIACDVSLMSNIHSLTTSLLSRLPKLNYLFNCAGYISVRGYNPTSEGIDKVMALYYYSRFKFVYELLPLLHKAKGNGEDGKVMSVLNARGGSAFEPDNIGLKKKYSLAGAARQSMTYNDLIVEVYTRLTAENDDSLTTGNRNSPIETPPSCSSTPTQVSSAQRSQDLFSHLLSTL